jgi:hypothetical protein
MSYKRRIDKFIEMKIQYLSDENNGFVFDEQPIIDFLIETYDVDRKKLFNDINRRYNNNFKKINS